MGPQAPAANSSPPAKAQIQTNKFIPPETPNLSRVKKQSSTSSSKETREEDDDDLPSLVCEKVRVKATIGASATDGTPSTPLPKMPPVKTAAGKFTVEEAEDEDTIESKPSHFSQPIFLSTYYCR